MEPETQPTQTQRDRREEVKRRIMERQSLRGVKPVAPPSPPVVGQVPSSAKRITLLRHELPCIHEGAVREFCKSCHGPSAEWRHVRDCDIHEKCTRGFVSHSLKGCDRCPDYRAEGTRPGESIPATCIGTPTPIPTETRPKQAVIRSVVPESAQIRSRIPVRPAQSQPGRKIRPSMVRGPNIQRMTGTPKPKESGTPIWAYGLTTVPQRRKDLLPRTLASLNRAGFPSPHLFVDGDWDYKSWRDEFGLESTMHYPRIRLFGNWMLALGELFIRNPKADYYAIFQDDFVTCLNLRAYLERGPFPDKGYLNLYTFPENQARTLDEPGWYRSNQKGKGAVALVFNLAGVKLLLAHNHMVSRPADPDRGHKFVDGGIIDTMKKCNWAEYIHNPSLVQHTGKKSSTGNFPQPLAPSFKGEDFDLLTLLPPEVHYEEASTLTNSSG